LEQGISDKNILARTEDGQQFRLRRDSLLGFVVAAFRRRYSELEDLPQPVSRFDDRFDQIKRAGAISTNEPLLTVARDVLRTAGGVNE
jgi:hypothetical protein